MQIYNIMIVFVLLLIKVVAQAGVLEIGAPAVGGTGCPQGTAHIQLNSNDELEIQFDQFVARAGKGTKKLVDLKTCNIVLPVSAPNGWEIGLRMGAIEGFVDLSKSAKATISAEVFAASSRGPILQKSVMGKISEDYRAEASVLDSVAWTGCSQATNLRIRTSVLVQASKPRQKALVTVDRMVPGLKLVARACN